MSAARYAIEAPSASAGDLFDGPTLRPLALTKRATFFLEEMMAAGSQGITTIDYPGVRVGDAIFKLRKAGVTIQTSHEQHGGDFAGHHGRYTLRSKIIRLDTMPAPILGAGPSAGATAP